MERIHNYKIKNIWSQCIRYVASRTFVIIFVFLFFFLYIIKPFFPNIEIVPLPLMSSYSPSKISLNDVDIWYILPPKLTGLMLLFHGCSHEGSPYIIKVFTIIRGHWFLLPEEKQIVSQCLRQGLGTVAVSSYSAQYHTSFNNCFDTSFSSNIDIERVLKAFGNFTSILMNMNQDYLYLPLYGIGASSGGSFITLLSLELRFHAILVEISPGSFVEKLNTRTAWLYMRKDHWASPERISESEKLLKRNGVDTITFEINPVRLTSSFLSNRIGVSEEASKYFYLLCSTLSLLDDDYLSEDPRKSRAASKLLKYLDSIPESVSGQELKEVGIDALGEEFNILYGSHELTSDRFEEVLTWMLKT